MEEISKQLNQYFKNYFNSFDQIYEDVDPKNLLSHNRIDVVAKIIYCEYFLKITPTKFNRLFYYIHLKKWNNFKANDSLKNCFYDYESEFKKTILSIKSQGFDKNKSIIPIDGYNKIIDGSHRLGASIVLNKKIRTARFLVNSPAVTIKKFINDFNLKNINIIDYLIFNFIKYNNSLRIFTLFPVRDKKFDEQCFSIIKKYGEILITKSMKIGNLINGFNICRTLYSGSEWLGNVDNKYKGAMWKAKNCFYNSDGVLDVILFSPNKKENATTANLKKLKEEIRNIYKIHFHSIHSSDNHIETIRYSKIFFHSNTQELLPKRKGIFYDNFEQNIENLNSSNIDSSQFVFSGSAVMAALGLRNPKDLDAFHSENFILPKSVSSHNSQIKYLKYKLNELIFNPKNYFFYMGFKFLHPKVLLKLKENRNTIKNNTKDNEDIKILKLFLSNQENSNIK